MKTTLFTNFYNEEYLLPHWLKHHKDMFDHGILVDYCSTDRSVEICKEICPTWEIITNSNPYFSAELIDKEFMEMEKKVEGVKIILNTTEFLFCEKPIKEIFEPYQEKPKSFSVQAYSPYSMIDYDPKSTEELFSHLIDDEMKYQTDRNCRFIHTYNHGNYSIGRHLSYYETERSSDMHIVWFGYYPFNEKILARKQQFHNRIPSSDIAKQWGIQHRYTKERIFEIREEFHRTGKSLQELSPRFYTYLQKHYNKQLN